MTTHLTLIFILIIIFVTNYTFTNRYKIQFIVSWGCVALTPKNSLRISLPLLRIIFNATANIPIIGKIIWEIYMISQAGYFPNWSGDILKNSSFFFLNWTFHHMEWNFVSKIVLKLCEKKLFLWLGKTLEIQGWRRNIWDHQNNLFKQWKVRTILEIDSFLTYSVLRTIIIQIGKNR